MSFAYFSYHGLIYSYLIQCVVTHCLFSFSLKFVGVPKVTHLGWILVFLTSLPHFISSRCSGYNLHFPSFCLIFRNPHLKDSGFIATEYSKHTYIHIHTYTSIITSRSVSNEYSGLISFRIDWLDLLAVQETLKGLFQLLFLILPEVASRVSFNHCFLSSPRRSRIR